MRGTTFTLGWAEDSGVHQQLYALLCRKLSNRSVVRLTCKVAATGCKSESGPHRTCQQEWKLSGTANWRGKSHDCMLSVSVLVVFDRWRKSVAVECCPEYLAESSKWKWSFAAYKGSTEMAFKLWKIFIICLTNKNKNKTPLMSEDFTKLFLMKGTSSHSRSRKRIFVFLRKVRFMSSINSYNLWVKKPQKVKYSVPCSCIMKLAFKILTWGVSTCLGKKWERVSWKFAELWDDIPNGMRHSLKIVPIPGVYLLFLMLPAAIMCFYTSRALSFSFSHSFLGLANKSLSRNQQPDTMKKPSADMKSSCETAHAAWAGIKMLERKPYFIQTDSNV